MWVPLDHIGHQCKGRNLCISVIIPRQDLPFSRNQQGSFTALRGQLAKPLKQFATINYNRITFSLWLSKTKSCLDGDNIKQCGQYRGHFSFVDRVFHSNVAKFRKCQHLLLILLFCMAYICFFEFSFKPLVTFCWFPH